MIGFRNALTKTLTIMPDHRRFKENEPNLSRRYQRRINAIISIKIPNPQFEGCPSKSLVTARLRGSRQYSERANLPII